MLSPGWFRIWRFLREQIRFKIYHIPEIEIRGLEHLQQCIAAKEGVLITPNHSCHADPSVVYWVADQLKMPFYFMAAWQLFQRVGSFGRLFLRQHGCFSVDREGMDIRAFREAVKILQHKSYPLVIFPEGVVYHLNARITPFHDGPAAIALTAQKHSERPVQCVPCGIRYQYIGNPTKELLPLMDRLEERILWRPRRQLVLRKRIYHFAEAILALKEQEYLGHTQEGSLPERIRALSEFVLSKTEEHYGIPDRAASLPERVKLCRRRAIQTVENVNLKIEEHVAARVDLEDLFFVTQLFSYPGTFTSKKPTIEEMAETLDKFDEDVLRTSRASIRGRRRAIIEFGEPVPAEPATAEKNQVQALTEQLEQRVQSLLDGIQFDRKRIGLETPTQESRNNRPRRV